MVGRTIGHYEIAERIGAGGMGEVYRAWDTRLERDVAFKVVSTTLSDADYAQDRLRKEALALSRLSHPNIATVHDFDIVDGVTFVTMELVPGADVRDRVAAGPLPEREVLHIGAQAAAALQAAHEAGVVHRDLKPGNLRITPDGRLKVLDFGLAVRSRRGEEVSRAATEAVSMQVAGTMPYMAPEQLRGEPADPRSDIYALAVVLHELATGRRPFDASPDAVLIDQILNAAPPSPRDVNPRVSPGLDAIIVKGLEKSPDRRYQSAREMSVDLERLRTPSATSATAVRVERSTRKRRAVRWAAAIGFGVLAAALGWSVWRGSLGGPVLSFAPRDFMLVADFDNQTGEAVFDTSLATAFAVGLGQSSHANLVARPRSDEALRRMGRTDAPRIDRALGREIAIREGARGLLAPGISRVGQQYVLSAALIDPQTATEVRAYVERADGSNEILDALGRIAESVRRDLGESLASIREQSRPLPLVTTASLEALQRHADGIAQWQRGRYSEALVHYHRAIELDPDFAMAHGALGIAYLSFVFNNDKLGREHLDRALALADRTTERERMFLQAVYQNRLGDWASAVTLYRAFLYRYPDDYAARFNLGGLLREMRRFDEAVAEYQEVIRLAPRNAPALINLATAQAQAGRAADSLTTYERAFEIEPAWKAGGNLNHEYGFALVRGGRADEAPKVFALTLGSPEERPRGLRSQALLDMWTGKYGQAEPRLTEAVRLNQSLNRTLTAGRDLLYLAILKEGLGDRRAAIALLDRAVAEMERVSSAVFLARAGIMYARAGELDRARRVLTVAQGQLKDGEPSLGPDVRRFEGELLVAQGRSEAGLEMLNKVDVEIGISPALTKESLGWAHERAGQAEAAIRAYEAIRDDEALGWEPQQAWLHVQYRLAALHAKRGERDKAAARLDRLLALWRDADPALPLMVAAKRLRAEL